MKFSHLSFIATGGFFVWLVALGPLKPYKKAFLNNESPQIVMVLGGDLKREDLGIKMAKTLGLPLLISGGSNREHALWAVKKSGLSTDLVILDYRAKDTLSNFTSIINELVAKEISHILTITSKDHMNRAMVVGQIVAGSRGVRLTSIPVSCAPLCKEETLQKLIFDFIRAIIWVATNQDPKIFVQENI